MALNPVKAYKARKKRQKFDAEHPELADEQSYKKIIEERMKGFTTEGVSSDAKDEYIKTMMDGTRKLHEDFIAKNFPGYSIEGHADITRHGLSGPYEKMLGTSVNAPLSKKQLAGLENAETNKYTHHFLRKPEEKLTVISSTMLRAKNTARWIIPRNRKSVDLTLNQRLTEEGSMASSAAYTEESGKGRRWWKFAKIFTPATLKKRTEESRAVDEELKGIRTGSSDAETLHGGYINVKERKETEVKAEKPQEVKAVVGEEKKQEAKSDYALTVVSNPPKENREEFLQPYFMKAKPLLIQEDKKISIYGFHNGKWQETELKNLSSSERKALSEFGHYSALHTSVENVSDKDITKSIHNILKKGHTSISVSHTGKIKEQQEENISTLSVEDKAASISHSIINHVTQGPKGDLWLFGHGGTFKKFFNAVFGLEYKFDYLTTKEIYCLKGPDGKMIYYSPPGAYKIEENGEIRGVLKNDRALVSTHFDRNQLIIDLIKNLSNEGNVLRKEISKLENYSGEDREQKINQLEGRLEKLEKDKDVLQKHMVINHKEARHKLSNEVKQSLFFSKSKIDEKKQKIDTFEKRCKTSDHAFSLSIAGMKEKLHAMKGVDHKAHQQFRPL